MEKMFLFITTKFRKLSREHRIASLSCLHHTGTDMVGFESSPVTATVRVSLLCNSSANLTAMFGRVLSDCPSADSLNT